MSSNADEIIDRQNVGRIDHVILLYRNRENQERARQKFTALLGIDDWDEIGEGSEGVYIIISWKSGIELMCPTKEIPVFERHLEKHGEGFYSLVFGVSNMDQAMDHIKHAGGGTPYVLGAPPEGVFRKFDVVREAIVGDVGGIRLMLGEFKLKA